MNPNNQKRYTHVGTKKFQNLDVIEDDRGRHYISPTTGDHLPSVTTVLGYAKRDFFDNWRNENPGESEFAVWRGSIMHYLIENELNNQRMLFYHPRDLFSLNLFRQKLINIDNIVCQESPLYSDILGVAGRVDCIAEYNDVLSIIDFKTAKKIKLEKYIQDYKLQACAYSLMWEHMFGERINQGVVIIASDDGVCKDYVFSLDELGIELCDRILDYESYHPTPHCVKS